VYTVHIAEVDSTKVFNEPQSMPDPIAISEAVYGNYSKYTLLLLITGGGHFRITMTVDKDIMEFEKKDLGNSEKVMDFLALGGVQTPIIPSFLTKYN
jgi:hypothetical protein